MFRAVTTQDLSAVTAACLMVRRDVFEEVGGLTEDLAVAFNDVDFCMKVRDKGYLVVYNPHAELYHYESKSRGYEDTGEKVARFNSEVEKLEKYWPDILEKGDPYYNPNLSILDGWYRLKEE
jgi:GT2 family glycosyltransferase